MLKVQIDKKKLIVFLLFSIEQKSDPICKGQLARIEAVTFSDFRLIPKFLQSCSSDIEKSSCGRLASKNSKNSQGETLACLQSIATELSDVCKKEIYHVREKKR